MPATQTAATTVHLHIFVQHPQRKQTVQAKLLRNFKFFPTPVKCLLSTRCSTSFLRNECYDLGHAALLWPLSPHWKQRPYSRGQDFVLCSALWPHIMQPTAVCTRSWHLQCMKNIRKRMQASLPQYASNRCSQRNQTMYWLGTFSSKLNCRILVESVVDNLVKRRLVSQCSCNLA